MVHARSTEGLNVSFLRPEKAVLPELQRLVPEVIEDLDLILSGSRSLDVEAVNTSLSLTSNFRDGTVQRLQSSGIPVPELNAWVPFTPQAA
jgi:hypothetical protein